MTERDVDDHQPYTGVGRPPLELLLLALIDGHPYDGDKNRSKRLDQAMLAITGKKAAPGPLPNDAYERGCLLMAELEHQDAAAVFDFKWRNRNKQNVEEVPPKVRTPHKLAEIAEERVFGSKNPHTQKANRQKLRELYTGSYQKKLKGRDGVDHRATYMYQVTEQDFVAESLERQSLKAITRELEAMGIAFKA